MGGMAFAASKVTLRFLTFCKVDIRSLWGALTVGTGASTSIDLSVMAASIRYEVLGLFGISGVIAAPAQSFESPLFFTVLMLIPAIFLDIGATIADCLSFWRLPGTQLDSNPVRATMSSKPTLPIAPNTPPSRGCPLL